MGRGARMDKVSFTSTLGYRLRKLMVLICVIVSVGAIYANPTDGVVVSGDATITQTATTTEINQTSNQAIINWNSFNIGANEATHFQQPDSNSIALNRINPCQGASQIFGQLTSNGRIILVNQAGIYFGPGSYVNVGGLIASTAGITDQNFLAGKLIFDQVSTQYGTIINQGTIIAAQHGLVALLGANVSNEGNIRANLGNVILASGNKFTVDLAGDGLVNFTIDAQSSGSGVDQNGQLMTAGVNNSGKIIANGGTVILTAKTAEKVLDNAINMSGVIVANSVTSHNGEIILLGGTQGKVNVSGKLIASGKKYNQTGGTVKVLGAHINLQSPTLVDVSGYNGGGKIVVGGDLHGLGPSPNALTTYVASGAVLNANALMSGNGGQVSVWSDLNTGFHGSITAQGGVASGHGGFVETSGGYLNISGATVNTLAMHGSTGTWLLDPTNIYIALDQANATAAGMVGNNTSANTISAGTSQSSGVIQDSLLTTSVLSAALGTANVVVTTTNASGTGLGNITIVDPFSWASTNTLTLTAANNIAINNTITTGAVGSGLILNAAGTVTQTAAIGGSGNLTQQGAGTVILSRANTYGGTTTISAGTLQVGAGGTTGSLGAGSVTNNAALVFNLSNATTVSNVIGGSGTLTQNGTGTLSLTSSNNYSGITTVNGGLTLSGSGALTGTTGVTINEGGLLTLVTSAGNASNLINTASTLTMNGGEFFINGLNNASTNSTQTLGALVLSSGYSTITLSANANKNTLLTFASLTNTAGATGLFRGTNLGANTVANSTSGATVGASNIIFTAAPTLVGSGNSGTNTVGIIRAIIGAGGASGSTSIGTDFLTYNPSGGTVNGLRPLLAAEYNLNPTSPINNANVKYTSATTSNINRTINSLLISGGITYNFGSGRTLTITSGNVLSTGGANTIQPSSAGTLAFGSNAANIFAASNLTTGSLTSITGTNGLIVSGPGVFQVNRSTGPTAGTLIVNSGTLQLGITNAFSTALAVLVNADGIFNLNGFNNSILGLTLYNGSASGAAVTTGAGTLTLGGNVIDNVNGTGTASALISGNLALGATRTFTVNGTVDNNLDISAIISGNTSGITKAGAGTLTLSGANTFSSTSGVTTISAGVLSVGTIGLNTGSASNLGAGTIAAANLVLSGGTLKYTGATASTNRAFTLTNATTSTIAITSSGTTLTLAGAAASTTGGLTFVGPGTLTLSAANAYTGTTTISGGTLAAGIANALSSGAVVVSGGTYNIGTFSDTVGAVTLTNGSIIGSTGVLTGTSYAVQNGLISAKLGGAVTLTKTTSGTVTLSGANTYSAGTTINAGTLIAQTSTTALGTGTVTLAGGTLELQADSNTNFGNNIIVSGNSTILSDRVAAGAGVTHTLGTLSIGAQTLTVSAGDSVSSGTAGLILGATTLTGGATLLSDTGVLLTLGNVTGTGQALTVSGAGNTTLSSGLNTGAAGTLIKNGTGTLTLPVASNYTGATTISNGVVIAQNALSLNTSTITLSGGTLDLQANSNTNFGNNIIVSGNSTILSDRVAAGAGVTHTLGTLSIGAQTLTVSAGANVSSGTAGLTLGATTLTGGATLSLNTGTLLTLGNVTGTGQALAISGAGNAILSAGLNTGSAGALTMSSTGTLILVAAGNYTGTTIISNGIVDAQNSAAFGTSAITVNSGVIQINGSGLSFGNALTLNGTGIASTGALRNLANNNTWSGAITLGTGGARINSDAGTLTIATGGITGAAQPLTIGGSGNTNISAVIGTTSGTLTKDGSGILTLSGSNTYSGGTVINSGTLSVTNTNGLGASGSLLVNAGTLSLNLGGNSLANSSALTLNGSGVGGVGALYKVGNNSDSLSNVIILGSNSTIGVSSNGTLTLNGAINDLSNGSKGLALEGLGTINLAGVVGGSSQALASIASSVSTIVGINTTAITTSGVSGQIYNGAVILNGSGTTTLTSSGGISFNSSLDGPVGLSIANGSGPVIFGGLVGNSSALASLTVGTGNQTTINSSLIKTTGNQVYNSAIANIGTAGTTFISTSGGAISLANASNNFTTSSVAPISFSISGGTNNVTVNNQKSLVLGTSNVSGALQIAVTGAGNPSISQKTNTTITAASLGLSTNAGNITLTENNSIGTLAAIINNGSTSNTFNLNNTANLTIGTVGSVVGIATPGNVTLNNGNADIILNNGISANGVGNTIILAGGKFTNNVGSNALNAGSGNFLVWSENPNNDNRGGIAYNFKQYNASYGVTTVLGTGNGFLYTLALTITPSLVGTVEKVYNATTTAALSSGNYSVSGAVDNDAVTLNNPAVGTYATQNVGTGINVSVSGISIASATNGGAIVYGYGLSTTSANANIGEITPASLVITATSGQQKTYGVSDPNGGFTYSETGLFAGDSLSGNLGRAAGENVGDYAYNLGGIVVNVPQNYNISLSAGVFAITPATLTITAGASQSKVYGTSDTDSGFTYGNTGLINGVTPQYWNSSGMQVNDVAINDTISGHLGRTSGENVGNYAYNIGSVAVSVPSNYNSSLTAGFFAITPATLIITAGASQSKIYGTSDTASGFTYSNTGLINGVTPQYWNSSGVLVNDVAINDTISGHLGRTSGENVGNYAYNIGSVAVSASSNYNSSLTAGLFAITPATLTITAGASQSKVYGTSETASGFTYTNVGLINGVTPQYWNSSGVLVNDVAINDTISGHLGRASGENVGNYAYNIGSVVTNAPSNYNSSLTTGSFAITPATLTITAGASQSKVYGTSDTASGFTYSNIGLINGVTPQYWNSSGVLVNDVAINDTISGYLGRASGENVGNYAYNIGSVVTNAPSNYNSSLTAGSFAITPATLTITAGASQSKVYGTSDTASGFTYSNTGLINGVTPQYWNSSGVLVNDVAINDTISGHLGRASGENVGNYAYNIGSVVTNAPSNYNSSLTAGSFAITPAILTITAGASQSKVYGTSDTASGFTYSNTGLINGVTPEYWNSSGVLVNDITINDTISGHLGRASGENVGNYAYNIGSVAVSAPSNYNCSVTAGLFGITPATLTITADTSQSKVYGTSDAASGFTYTKVGLINGVTPQYWNSSGVLVNDVTINDTISGHLGRVSGENVGSYAYNIGSVATNIPSNYNSSLTAGLFAITPATLTITANASQSKIYGTNDPSNFSYNTNGLINGVTPQYWNSSGMLVNDVAINDTISGNLGRAVGENVGNYAYNIGSVVTNAPSNYNSSLTAGTFAITPAPLSVTANAANKVYGVNDPTFTYNAVGFINAVVDGVTINDNADNSLTGALSRVLLSQANENVGAHIILQGTLASSNYAITYNSANLTITPATLTVTANSQSKVYGTNDPSLTYSASGLVNGIVDGIAINDTVGNTLTGNLTRAQYGTLAGEQVANGPFAITQGSVASLSNNYTLNYVGNDLTITPASLTVTGVVANNKPYDATTAATLNTTNGVLSGVVNNQVVDGVVLNDVGNVTLTGSGTGYFSSPNVGNAIPVTATDIYLTGSAATNYVVTPPTGLSANITGTQPTPPHNNPVTNTTTGNLASIVFSSYYFSLAAPNVLPVSPSLQISIDSSGQSSTSMTANATTQVILYSSLFVVKNTNEVLAQASKAQGSPASLFGSVSIDGINAASTIAKNQVYNRTTMVMLNIKNGISSINIGNEGIVGIGSNIFVHPTVNSYIGVGSPGFNLNTLVIQPTIEQNIYNNMNTENSFLNFLPSNEDDLFHTTVKGIRLFTTPVSLNATR